MFVAAMHNLLLVVLLFGNSHVWGSKREISNEGYGVFPSIENSVLLHNLHNFPSAIYPIASPSAHIPTHQHVYVPKSILVQKIYGVPTSADIAGAVASAKEATANIMAAQHRVRIANEEVLNQQKLANFKEAQAALALQKTAAAAAIQRQQASDAANAVVQAQHRLAHAKADVAQQQRIAAEKEATVAAAIQAAANAASAEIKKTENIAAKVAAVQSSEAAAALKHVTAAKDASLAATSAAVAAIHNHAVSTGVAPLLFPSLGHFNHWG